MSYGVFSSVYDILTDNVQYKKIANRICSLLSQNGIDGGLLLDLGCGTGTLSFILEENGYDIIGVDQSFDMLSVANEKKYELNSNAIFLCQSAEELDLYGTVDCAVCVLDTINHINTLDKVKQAIEKVSLFMNMNGVFIFDINTLYKHEQVLADNTFVYDMDEVYCVWQNSYCEAKKRTDIDLDFFIKEENGENFERYSESFSEFSYDTDDILNILNDSGFEILQISDDYSDSPVNDKTERAVFVARKTKTVFKGETK